DKSAIQWRMRWSCTTGRLVVAVSSQRGSLVDAPCPGKGTAESTHLGPTTARISAAGTWDAQVDQQVDVPLDQPPLPAMRAPDTQTAATGRFYRIDQSATGRATFYRLADGGYALRLDPFYVTPNV